MDADKKKVFHPFAVWAEGLALWGKNFLPLVALSSVSMLLARIVQLSKPLWLPMPATPINISFSVFFILEIVAAAFTYALITLLVIHHIKGYAATGRVVFAEAFDAAKKGLFYYLFVVAILFLSAILVPVLAAFFLGIGESVFRAPGGDRAVKVAVLIGSGTVFVVAVIAVIWYGFFFSLAPLIAALEKKGPLAAIAASRRRIKGNAFRYLGTLLLFIVGYVGLGLLFIKALMKAGAGRFIINMVDPVLFAVLGTLWLVLWYLCYEKLTEIKQIS